MILIKKRKLFVGIHQSTYILKILGIDTAYPEISIKDIMKFYLEEL